MTPAPVAGDVRRCLPSATCCTFFPPSLCSPTLALSLLLLHAKAFLALQPLHMFSIPLLLPQHTHFSNPHHLIALSANAADAERPLLTHFPNSSRGLADHCQDFLHFSLIASVKHYNSIFSTSLSCPPSSCFSITPWLGFPATWGNFKACHWGKKKRPKKAKQQQEQKHLDIILDNLKQRLQPDHPVSSKCPSDHCNVQPGFRTTGLDHERQKSRDDIR